MKEPAGSLQRTLSLTLRGLAAGLLTCRNRDLDRLAATAREPGEHRVDKARDDDVEPVRLGPRLGAAVKQRRIGGGLTNVEVDLAVVFDVTVDPAAISVPERIVPAPAVGSAESPAETRAIEAPVRVVEAAISIAVTAAVKRIAGIADLAPVDAIAELHDHVRGPGVRCRLIAARLKLLRYDRRITLEFKSAIIRHSARRHDVKSLALRRRHRLVPRHDGVDGLGAGRKSECRRANCEGG